jgi:toxin ParE1/3/4
MPISWSAAAGRDLIAIVRFIERDNPRAAAMTLRRIRDAVTVLVDQPSLGRPGRVIHTRELVIERTPYIVPYQLVEGRVIILRVYHAARQWPERFD